MRQIKVNTNSLLKIVGIIVWLGALYCSYFSIKWLLSEKKTTKECGVIVAKFGQDRVSKHRLYEDLKLIVEFDNGELKEYNVSATTFIKFEEKDRICFLDEIHPNPLVILVGFAGLLFTAIFAIDNLFEFV